MGLRIYQIGDLPIFFNLRNYGDDAIELKADREWRESTTDFTQTPGQHAFSELGRSLPNAQKMTINGLFMCDDGSSGQKLYTQLLSMGGIAFTPIVAFRYEECDHEDTGRCCSICNKTLDWLINYGTITQIGQNPSYMSSKKPWLGDIYAVAVDMTLQTKWKALSAWEWEYRRTPVINPLSTQLERESTTNTFRVPSALEDLRKSGFFFRWGIPLSKYDPSFWGIKYSEGRLGGFGSDYTTPGSHGFYSDPALWSASPNSVYAFTNFTDVSGSVSLKVTRNYGYFSGTSLIEDSTLDLDDLNTDLMALGQGGLYPTDTIITGYAAPFPGFVVRNDEIIEGVRPRWSYSGSYPGETGRGYNDILISCTNTTMDVAYLHDFGTY